MVGAEARAGEQDLLRAGEVVVDERDDALEQPALVDVVAARPLLQRQPAVVPRAGVPAVDAVDLHPSGRDEVADRLDHPALLVLVGAALLGGKGEQRAAVVAVDDDVAALERDLGPAHLQTRASRRPSSGWSESRQPTQVCPSRTSASSTS